MAGRGRPQSKPANKVKAVKPIKKISVKTQRSLDSFWLSTSDVIPVNSDQFVAEDDPDYEAMLENDGTEWVDVDVLSPLRERSVLERDNLSQP